MSSKLRVLVFLALALGLVLTGGGCGTFRGLTLDLTIDSGPRLKLFTGINADSVTNGQATVR